MAQLNINFFNPQNPYRFADPVRKYKENDPYHYTVDNIPIKQLEENILWIKDVLENATVDVEDGKDGVYRENFMELKPYLKNEGPQNAIYVNPGRFTARINDAYNLTPLQVISRVLGEDVGDFNEWDVASRVNPVLSGTLEKFKSAVAQNALGMNGLAERSFVSPFTSSTDYIFNYSPINGDVTPFNYTQFNLTLGQEYPNFFTFLWGTTGSLSRSSSTARATSWAGEGEPLEGSQNSVHSISQNARNLFFSDVEFVRRWRGVARTSIVDVPYTLSATVQNFENDDFSYLDENGDNNNSLSSLVNSRIDLLFIYSKPIDQTETYISEFERTDPVSSFGNSPDEESPRRLVRAELGIVRGAGVKMDFGAESKWFFANANGSLGSPQILAHAADQANTDLGFASLNVHGSFPSPDDLMNLSPMLAEWLPKKHIALVGQTILPLAYIVVKKSAVTNGVTILEDSDVIDIRPFFRTAELTYNERAGLAAALPSVSLANPVATESYVDTEVKKVYDAIPALPPVPLFRDQFNVIDASLDTKHLIRIGGETLNSWPGAFGGHYYGRWPLSAMPYVPSIDSGAVVFPQFSSLPVIANGGMDLISRDLDFWKTNPTGDYALRDGVYKLPDSSYNYKRYGSDNVAFFVFTVKDIPALYGPQPDGSEWDITVDCLTPTKVTHFAPVAKNLSGGPMYEFFRATSDTFDLWQSGVTLTDSLVRSPLLRHKDFSYSVPEWYFYNNPGGANPTHLTGGGNGETPQVYTENRSQHGTLLPGFINNIERPGFNGQGLFSDYDFLAVAARQNFNRPPVLTRDSVTQWPSWRRRSTLLHHMDPRGDVIRNSVGVSLRQLYKAPASFYGNRSVDLKFVVMVSNRISIKQFRFTLTNMRVS